MEIINLFAVLIFTFNLLFFLNFVSDFFLTDSINFNPSGFTTEKPSPSDRISSDQILVFDDQVLIDVKNAKWGGILDTNSMDPVLDEESHVILITPQSENEVKVGDIVTFKSDLSKNEIVHRVVEIGYDFEGWYSVTKGDNNSETDSGKVRFNQITGIVVAIIY